MKSSVKKHQRVTLSLLAVILAIAALSVLWLTPFSTTSNMVAAQGTVNIYMDPSTQSVAPGVTFDVAVRIDAGTQGVAAADDISILIRRIYRWSRLLMGRR